MNLCMCFYLCILDTMWCAQLQCFVLEIVIIFSKNGFTTNGCYWNDDDTTLIDLLATNSTSTVQCMEMCITANKGYIYAGTQKTPMRCSCGLSITSQSSRIYTDGSPCNFPCPIAITDLCGGSYRLAIYDISGDSIPITLGDKETTPTTVMATKQQSTTYTSPTTVAAGLPVFPLNGSSQTTSGTERLTTEIKTTSINVPSTTNSSGLTAGAGVIGIGSVCSCRCGKWSFLYGLNLTKEELLYILQEDLQKLHDELVVDVKTTSLYKNKRISAPDFRTSSRLMGYSGGAIICISILVIVSCDVVTLCGKYNRKR